MGVYIKGLKLPSAERQGELLILTDDGRCVDMFSGEYEAVELQPHGRLIDADAKVQTQLYDDEHEEWTDVEMTVEEDLGYCNNEVPTIIETEPKQKKYSTSEWCSECQRQKCFECCTAILKDGEVDEPTGFQRIQHIEDAPTIVESEGT